MRRRGHAAGYQPPLPTGLAVGQEAVEAQRLLGEGTQGLVYEVRFRGQPFALKLYRPESATEPQRARVERLIDKRAPAPCFLWPEHLVTQAGGTYGYLMALREPRFRACEDIVARRVSASFATLMTAGLQLSDGFRRLHAQGLCYSDISFGNVFFDPQTGDIRICDNDNVDADGAESTAVLGTPRFMAPEIVRGAAWPSADSDRFSLAVLLFQLLLGGHPLDGAREAAIRSLDLPAMRRLYGDDPVYIFDEANPSNRPVPGIHDNPEIFRSIYPEPLMKLFAQSFTEGLHAPRKRVLETDWLRAFVRARDRIQRCTCGRQAFAGTGRLCWKCQQPLPSRLLLELDQDWRVVLEPGRALAPHHLDSGRTNDFSGEVARVVEHPQDPRRLGLRNEGEEAWTLQRPDRSQDQVAPGQAAPLVDGNVLHFLHGRQGRVRSS